MHWQSIQEKESTDLDVKRGRDWIYEVNCGRDLRYIVKITDLFLDASNTELSDALKGRNCLIITTPTVHRLYYKQLMYQLHSHQVRAELLVLDCDEKSKTIDSVNRISRYALEMDIDRNGALVAFGGGVCSDLVTVAASLIRRGVKHIRIPTTLLGQVDASIGIKGGINFRGRKNYLGCFYPPEAVLISPQLVQTMTQREIRSGLAEIIKVALIGDADLFGAVELNGKALVESRFARPQESAYRIIQSSVRMMLEELEPNIYEDRTYQRLCDLGHTFSPLLEESSGFSLRHGEAVAIDIALTSMIALELGYITEKDTERIIRLLLELEFQLCDPLLTIKLCDNALRTSATLRGGDINLVLPTAIGAATFVVSAGELPSTLIQRALNRLNSICR